MPFTIEYNGDRYGEKTGGRVRKKGTVEDGLEVGIRIGSLKAGFYGLDRQKTDRLEEGREQVKGRVRRALTAGFTPAAEATPA